MNPILVIPPELHWLCSATWQAAVLAVLVLLIQGLDVRKDVLLDHTDIASATAHSDPLGNPVIDVQMTEAGAKRFAEITRSNIGRQLAIIVDGRLLSAPSLRSEFTGGRAWITGSFSDQDAAELAAKINAAVKPSSDPIVAVVPTTQATEPIPSSGVMSALLTPEELGQGWSWRIDVVIDPASQPAELLRGNGQLKERVRETVRTGSAVGVASVRYADPDRTGFEVWAYRFADSATARRARRALLAGDIQPSSRVIEGMEALVFEGRAHQGPTLWLHHETFAVAIAVKPPSFPDSLMSVVSHFALHLRRIAEPNSRGDAAPR
jgi:hypothetical protein